MKNNGWNELSESLSFGGRSVRQKKRVEEERKTLNEWFEEIDYPPDYKEFFPEEDWRNVCLRAVEINAETNCGQRTSMRWALAQYFFERQEMKT